MRRVRHRTVGVAAAASIPKAAAWRGPELAATLQRPSLRSVIRIQKQNGINIIGFIGVL